jgi:adenosine deaminase
MGYNMKMNEEQLQAFFLALPKIELHLHLEGAIPLETLWELVKKYGGHKELGNNMENLKNKFVFRDFPHFIETWIWKNQFIREYADLEFIAGGVARDLAGQNIRYAEVFFTPSDFAAKGLKIQGIAEAVAGGFAGQRGDTELRLICDLCRDAGPARGREQLEEIKDLKSLGIIGIGIGGSEQHFPPEPFKEVYEKARAYGFKTTAHAGEAAGAASVWGALRDLHADRIGHGTRSYEDPALLDFLKDKQTPIEMCPLSNVRTCVIKSIREHPVRDYFERGLNVFVNTDDPKMFHNSLADEYMCLVKELGFSLGDIGHLLQNAVNAAWCGEENKQALKREIEGYYYKIFSLK